MRSPRRSITVYIGTTGIQKQRYGNRQRFAFTESQSLRNASTKSRTFTVTFNGMNEGDDDNAMLEASQVVPVVASLVRIMMTGCCSSTSTFQATSPAAVGPRAVTRT